MTTHALGVEQHLAKEKRVLEEEDELFHEKTFSFKKCSKFFPSAQDEDICRGCRYSEASHKLAITQPWIRDSEKWRNDTIVVNVTKKLFGEILFKDEFENIDKTAPIAVVANNSSPKTVVENIFLGSGFNLDLPSLVISVVGDHGKVSIEDEERQLERFKTGFMKAATSAETWILTGGTNLGVDRFITELMKENLILEWIGVQETMSKMIGLVNWNLVDYHEDIGQWFDWRLSKTEEGEMLDSQLGVKFHQPTNKAMINHRDGASEDDEFSSVDHYTYRVNAVDFIPKNVSEYKTSLNPFCNGFLCMDSGVNGDKMGAVSNICDIEGYLARQKSLPIVLVTIGGGVEVFERVKEAVTNTIPVVLCCGSGGATDILSYTLNQTRNNSPTKRISEGDKKRIFAKLEAELSNIGKDEGEITNTGDYFSYAKCMAHLQACVQNRHLIVEYKLSAPTQSIDGSILQALFLAIDAKGHDVCKLTLAVKWNRCDSNVYRLLEDVDDINGYPNIHHILMECINEEKLEFIRVFIEYGLRVERFITPHVLNRMYQEIAREYGPFGALLRRANGGGLRDVTLTDVYNIIRNYTSVMPEAGAEQEVTDPESTSYFYDVFREVALWAVFCNRGQISKFFWERSKSPLILALLMSELWRVHSTALTVEEGELEEEMREHEAEYNTLAQAILTQCWEQDADLCQRLVDLREPEMGYKNCIDLAAYCEAKHFIATACVQAVIGCKWKNEMQGESTDFFKALVFPPAMRKLLTRPKQLGTVSLDEHIVKTEEERRAFIQTSVKRKATGDLEALDDINQLEGFDLEHPVAVDDDDEEVVPKKDQISIFYSAPIIKFVTHTLAYVVFLLMFSDFYIWRLALGARSASEYVQFMFMFCYLVESLRQFTMDDAAFRLKLVLWCKSEWNIVDFLYLSSGVTAFFIHALPHDSAFTLTRVLYATVVLLMWMKLLRFQQVNARLGPIWIMIRRMLVETAWFFCIFGAIVVSCGMCIYLFNVGRIAAVGDLGLAEPFTDPNWLFLRPFFMFNGELFLDNVEGGSNPVLSRIAVVFFLFFGNALMLNLLVALYGSVYNEISENSDTEWKNELFWLLKEYQRKTLIPPPLSIVESVIRIVLFIKKRKAGAAEVEERVDMFGNPLPSVDTLKRFEAFGTSQALKKIISGRTNEEIIENCIDLEEEQLEQVKECCHKLNGARLNLAQLRQRRRERKVEQVVTHKENKRPDRPRSELVSRRTADALQTKPRPQTLYDRLPGP